MTCSCQGEQLQVKPTSIPPKKASGKKATTHAARGDKAESACGARCEISKHGLSSDAESTSKVRCMQTEDDTSPAASTVSQAATVNPTTPLDKHTRSQSQSRETAALHVGCGAESREWGETAVQQVKRCGAESQHSPEVETAASSALRRAESQKKEGPEEEAAATREQANPEVETAAQQDNQCGAESQMSEDRATTSTSKKKRRRRKKKKGAQQGPQEKGIQLVDNVTVGVSPREKGLLLGIDSMMQTMGRYAQAKDAVVPASTRIKAEERRLQNLKTTAGTINSIPVTAVNDTAATITAMNDRFFQRVKSEEWMTEESDVNAVTADGQQMFSLGEVYIPYVFNKREYVWPTYIMKDLKCACMMGADFLNHVGATVDYARNEVSYSGKVVPRWHGDVKSVTRREKKDVPCFTTKTVVLKPKQMGEIAVKVDLKDEVKDYEDESWFFEPALTPKNGLVWTTRALV